MFGGTGVYLGSGPIEGRDNNGRLMGSPSWPLLCTHNICFQKAISEKGFLRQRILALGLGSGALGPAPCVNTQHKNICRGDGHFHRNLMHLLVLPWCCLNIEPLPFSSSKLTQNMFFCKQNQVFVPAVISFAGFPVPSSDSCFLDLSMPNHWHLDTSLPHRRLVCLCCFCLCGRRTSWLLNRGNVPVWQD